MSSCKHGLPRWKKLYHPSILLFAASTLLIGRETLDWITSQSAAPQTMPNDVLQTYEWPSDRPEPEFLDQVDFRLLRPLGLERIDLVHRMGLYHTGSWIHVSRWDHDGEEEEVFLLLKRGPHLVTCPNSWSLLGEHTHRNETPEQTVWRGLSEELGIHDANDHNMAEVRALTDHPVFYVRHYGPGNANRVDRQLTYLWHVRLPSTFSPFLIKVDDEVADVRWITLKQMKHELEQDIVRLSANQSDGITPLFCHDSIHSLLRLTLDQIGLLQRTQ